MSRFGKAIITPDVRIPRPTTFEAGRALIYKTFVENRWRDRDVRVYFEQKGTTADTPDGVKKILDSMAESRMILFQDGRTE